MQKVYKSLRLTIRLIVILAFVPLFFSQSIHAQAIKYAQAGMPFLKLDVSPRNAAMGGAQIGVVGNPLDMFANPAGLATIEGFEVASSVTNWIVDTRLYGTGAAYNAGNLGVFGVGLIWMDYGTIERTVPVTGAGADPELRNKGYISDGTFSVQEYALGLSYARNISSQFAIGGQVKYALQNLGDVVIYDEFADETIDRTNEVSNIVLDFGTIYYTGFKDLRFGMSFRNFSDQSDYFDQRFELPLNFTFGLAMDVLTLFSGEGGLAGSNNLTVAFDWVHPRDYAERQHLGLEYVFNDMLFLRGGYRFNYDEQGLTAGLGVNFEVSNIGLNVNYSYDDFGKYFNAVNRIAFGVAF
ncbi:MAG TPA: PorV/PorQ family protein [bacterium]|nr:PorV/PorQ family protein [bacterium]